MLDIINFIFLIIVVVIVIVVIYFIKQQLDFYNDEITKLHNSIYEILAEKYQNKLIEEKIQEINKLNLQDLKNNQNQQQTTNKQDKNPKDKKQEENQDITNTDKNVGSDIKNILTDNLTINQDYVDLNSEKNMVDSELYKSVIDSLQDGDNNVMITFLNTVLSENHKNQIPENEANEQIVEYSIKEADNNDSEINSENSIDEEENNERVIDSPTFDVSPDFIDSHIHDPRLYIENQNMEEVIHELSNNVHETEEDKETKKEDNVKDEQPEEKKDISEILKDEYKKQKAEYKDLILNNDIKQIKIMDLKKMIKFFNIHLDKAIQKYKKDELYSLIKNKIDQN